MKKTFLTVVILITIMIVYSCKDDSVTEPDQSMQSNALLEKKSGNTGSLEEATESKFLKNVNKKLEGKNFRVFLAEWITSAGSEQAGQTVYAFNVGNKQLGHHFVPGDP